MIVADERGRYQFRHALLREVVHDDLLPGEHAELHLRAGARARGPGRRDRRGRDHHAPASPTTTCSAGCQREALVASVRAADAAERVHAHGEAGALLERALDLWPRVPDAMAQAGCDRVELVRRASRALINDGAHARAEALLEQALRRGRRAARAARWPPACSSCCRAAQWALGRAEDAREAIARAVALLPEDEARAPSAPASSRGRPRSRCSRAASARRCGRARGARRGAEADAGPARRRAQRAGPRADPARRRRGGQRRLREAIAISPRRLRARRAPRPTWPTRCTSSGRSRRRSPSRSRASADTAGAGSRQRLADA